MKTRTFISALMLLMLAATSQGHADDVADFILAAVDSANRPDRDKSKDLERKPAQLMTFFGVEQGHVVAELQAGGGYFTHILSNSVGPSGLVYAHNNSFLNRQYGANSPLTQRIQQQNLANVIEIASELDALNFKPNTLDILFMILDYHDTVWLGTDRVKMNEDILRSIKPGGIFAVTDHHAEAGSGVRDVETLHRIDRDVVINEVLASGFELIDEAEFLRNSEPRTLNIFTDGLRGYTDQFVLKFRKPLQDTDVSRREGSPANGLQETVEVVP